MYTPAALIRSAIARSARPWTRIFCIRLSDGLLLEDGHQLAGLADAVAPGHSATQVAASLAPVALDLGDALAGPIALGFGDRRQGW
jgi:hypothetical protein